MHPDYFAYHLKAPAREQYLLRKALAGWLNDMTDVVNGNGAGVRLLKLVLAHINSFMVSIQPEKGSYLRLQFIRELVSEIDGLLEQNPKDVERGLLRKLVWLNLNSRELFEYCKNLIDDTVDGPGGDHEKLRQLEALHRDLCLQPIKPGSAWEPKWGSLHAWLQEDLQEEIRLVWRAVEEGAMLAPSAAHAAGDPEKRIKTNLTVPELGALLRAFIQVGIIVQDRPLRRFMDILAKVFESKQQKEEGSAGTMRRKSKRLTLAQKSKLADFLFKVRLYILHH